MRILAALVLVLLGPALALGFTVGVVAGVVALAVSMTALGAFGVWLAMVSPVQLQPAPAIVFLLGFAVLLIAGWVA